jgi:predicted PurR-regulated permease PerM
MTVGVVIALIIYLLVHFLSSELKIFQQNWPDYELQIKATVIDMNSKLELKYPFTKSLHLYEKLQHLREVIPQYIIAFLPVLTYAFIIPFVTFFFLIGGGSIIDYLLDHFPSKYTEIILHITSRIDGSLGNYLRGILTEAFIIFLITFAGLYMLHLNYAGFIAILIGVSSLVPYLGAVVGAVVSSGVAYFQFHEFMPIVKILIFFGGIRFLDDWVIQPNIMKKAVELSPAIILFALMAGETVGGIWGVIFAIPVTCIIKELVQIGVELQESEFRWKPKPEPTRISIPYT